MPIPHRVPLLATLLLLAAGCDAGPGYVYVPAPGYQQGLTVRADLPTDSLIGAGQWVTLHANRIMGPWVRVHRDSVPEGATCKRKGKPTSPDLEIASKLQWQVIPTGTVKFNMPEAPDYERRIQFNAPGDYRLWAVSDGPCGGEFASDTLHVKVR
jgi:hypothetical protein